MYHRCCKYNVIYTSTAGKGGIGLGGGGAKKGVRTVLYDNYGSAYGVTSKHIFLPLLIYNLICFTHDFNFT